MSGQSLQQLLEAADNPAEMLRNSPAGSFTFPELKEEYTNWIEEQRAWRESVALADQTYHMTGIHVEGPDALDLFADLGIGNYRDFEPGRARQFLPCNPDGYTIGDGILFYLDKNELEAIGAAMAPNWVEFNAETKDYDVAVERHERLLDLSKGDKPTYFRFELMGPNSLDLLEEVTEEPLPDTSFYHFDELRIAGHDVRGLRHTMSGEAGLEIWGDFEYGDEIKETIMEAGEDYGIRHLGTRTYRSSAPLSGWVEFQVPAIYESEEMREYREWLSAESLEANFSIGGSFRSEDITDYYMSPADLGHADKIDFDHDFVGREALQEIVDNQQRTKVTLLWDGDDVVDIYASLFQEEDTYKFIDLLNPSWDVGHYDKVIDDEGETVGVSTWGSYNYNERTMLSMASVNLEYAEPGTELTLVWGESDSTKPSVERHTETEIDVSVAPVRPFGDKR